VRQAAGRDAGQHGGVLTTRITRRFGLAVTLPLLQEVLEVAQVPVAAAGGIASGAGLAAVLAAGAEAGWVGTAFLACPETLSASGARDRVLAAGAEDTVYTRVFDVAQGVDWPWRWHGRALRNDFTDLWHDRAADLAGNEQVRSAFAQAVRSGDYTTAHVYAGQAVGLVRAARPAGQVVAELAEGAEALLRQRIPGLLGAPEDPS
jgi:nitronate monooxygenase